jgi:hypothetical protein
VIWLLLGSLGLIVVVPELARSNLFAPRVFAVTHAFTLGVILHAVFGAMHQFLPAVVGVPIRYPRMARAGLLLFVTGTPLLVAGFWWWSPALQGAGWILLFVAVGFASMNLLPARRRAVRHRYVGALVSLAHSALGGAMLLAALRIGDGLGWWHVERIELLAVHFHLGVAGFGTLTALAFGSRMLPAFLGSSVEDSRRITIVAALVSAGLLIMSGALIPGGWIGFRIGGAVLLVGALVHLQLLFDYFRMRKPNRLDPGLAMIAVAAVSYTAAVIAGIVLLVLGGPRWTLWAGYGFFAIIGWLMCLILGVMHRVAPRLLVLARAGAGRPLTPAARRVELVNAKLGWATCVLFAAGIAITGSGLVASLPDVSRAGSGLIALAALSIVVQAIRIGRGSGHPNTQTISRSESTS